jgi:hypothetical protein
VREDVKKSLFRAVSGFCGPASLPPGSFKVSMLNSLQSPRYYRVFAAFEVKGTGFPFSDRVGSVRRNIYRRDPSYTTDLHV